MVSVKQLKLADMVSSVAEQGTGIVKSFLEKCGRQKVP